jgi:hypothetical protein
MLTSYEEQKKKIKVKIDRRLKQLIAYRMREDKVTQHLGAFERKRSNFERLNTQVALVGQGNIQRARTHKRRFKLDIDQKFVNRSLQVLAPTETGFPCEAGKEHRRLMRKCFDRSNKALANIVHTTEKK